MHYQVGPRPTFPSLNKIQHHHTNTYHHIEDLKDLKSIFTNFIISRLDIIQKEIVFFNLKRNS